MRGAGADDNHSTRMSSFLGELAAVLQRGRKAESDPKGPERVMLDPCLASRWADALACDLTQTGDPRFTLC